MIDLHTHALFGIDDGARTLDDSIAMLRTAYANGITTCVLTPHCVLHKQGATERFLNLRDKNTQKIESLNLKDIPLLLRGAQVLMDHDLSLHKGIAKLCIDGGKYLLIELPNFARIPDFDEWIYNLNMKGIVPIISNVENYPLWKDLIEALSSVNVCYQVNACTFNNLFKRRVIKKLIKEQKEFFVASNMHNLRTAKAMPKVLKKAKRLFPQNFSAFLPTKFDFYK